jgi:hypothetical protein
MASTIPDEAIVAVDASQTDHSGAIEGWKCSNLKTGHTSVILSDSRGWRIVGRVLWWIGKAP